MNPLNDSDSETDGDDDAHYDHGDDLESSEEEEEEEQTAETKVRSCRVRNPTKGLGCCHTTKDVCWCARLRQG